MTIRKSSFFSVQKDIERSVKNLRIASELFKFAYQIKYYQIKLKNPALSHHEIHRLTLQLFDKAAS